MEKLINTKVRENSKLVKDNPLVKFKIANPYLTWAQMAEVSELSVGGILRIGRMEKKDVGKVKVETLMRLNNAFDIDLWGWINN